MAGRARATSEAQTRRRVPALTQAQSNATPAPKPLSLFFSARPPCRWSLDSVTGSFAFKYIMSFMAYFDAYQDSLAAATAFRCEEEPVAQQLAPWMLGYFLVGVVGLQWCVVTWASSRDPTRACMLKLLHMETVCARITLQPTHKKTWVLIQAARTVGEDIPQSITQLFFVIFVKAWPWVSSSW